MRPNPYALLCIVYTTWFRGLAPRRRPSAARASEMPRGLRQSSGIPGAFSVRATAERESRPGR